MEGTKKLEKVTFSTQVQLHVLRTGLPVTMILIFLTIRLVMIQPILTFNAAIMKKVYIMSSNMGHLLMA